jgi:hypothetical protein
MPKMTNDLIIQEFCLMGRNDFVVASNTLDAKQGHGASFFHGGQQVYIPSSRYVLPKDLDAAIRHLDDEQLDRLVSVALEERARRKRPPVPEQTQRKRNAEAISPPLPQGKLNAVRAAFKAGVTPARIAREFGISRADVQRTLAGDAKK